MCGRFVSSSTPEEIARYFDVAETSEQASEHHANFNTAPTTDVLVVYQDGTSRRLDTFHWGLVPRWAKDLSIGNRMINARAETVASKPAFRHAFAKKRCIIPVDGFYEWKAPPPGQKAKQPYFIHRPDGEPYAFAGLWEQWIGPGPDGAATTVRSTTIITGPANGAMSTIHDRMPIILPPSEWATWLSPEVDDTEMLGRLLVPAPDGLIAMHAVSTDVNNVRNKGEHLVDAVGSGAD
ncbi:MAG: SOS response-associated peptidase [Actinobacteria bacterium]|nr:SOS response-associated peptidase [Actinomycetota bacterium]